MYLLHNFKALGTICNIEVFDEINPIFLNKIKENITNEINNFEETYSRFKPTSIISELNKKKIINFIPDDLRDMIEISRNINRDTSGVFNILIAQILENKGYGGEYAPLCKSDFLEFEDNLELTNNYL